MHQPSSEQILANIKSSVDFLRDKMGETPKIAVVLGSGLAGFVHQVRGAKSLPYVQIPGFVKATVEGHPGELVWGEIEKRKVIVLRGRFHFYEGHSLAEVVHPVRVAKALGCETVILTNASGGMGDGMRPGHFMVIRDQINLTGQNPLIGPNIAALGPRFVDMTEAFDKKYREILLGVLASLKIPHSEGVYCGVSGPTYETPAEIEFFKHIGAQAVGMSTVPEVIAARHAGLKIVGLSCITNLAAGLGGKPLNHQEVTAVANQIETAFATALSHFIGKI